MSAPILAFDIETIPDVAALRQLHNFASDVTDAEVVAMDARLRRQEKNHDFLPPHLHRIVVISCVMRYFDNTSPPLKILSLAPPEYDEAQMVLAFFRTIEKYTPRLVSWNGGGFDLPVLNWRAMKYQIAAPRYWQIHGADDYGDKFRWNNYTSRYHDRHTDLMDILGMYQTRTSLDDAARLCGLPGKIGIGGDKVWEAWQRQEIDNIRRYCETDALLTYLLFTRWQNFRGIIKDVAEEDKIVRECLDPEVWAEFLSRWND